MAIRRSMIIYVARCRFNGKAYVGQTINTLDHRWKEHLHDASAGADTLFYRALRKHGVEAFDVSVLEVCTSRAELNDRERWWIAELKTFGEGGYNATEGGQGCVGFKHDEETKQHLRLVLSGRTPSQETRQRMSEAQKARMTRSPHSPEARQRMSEGAKRRIVTDETRAKIAANNRVRVITEETRQRMSEAQRKRYGTKTDDSSS